MAVTTALVIGEGIVDAARACRLRLRLVAAAASPRFSPGRQALLQIMAALPAAVRVLHAAQMRGIAVPAARARMRTGDGNPLGADLLLVAALAGNTPPSADLRPFDLGSFR